MENASKALLMAGGILLTMLVVTVLMYAFGLVSEYQANKDRLREIEEVAKFNQQFTGYERNDVLGYEVLSLVNKVIDYNQRHSFKGNETTSSVGNTDQFKHITVKIKMYDNSIGDSIINPDDGKVSKAELTNNLATIVTVPATEFESERTYPTGGIKLQLFTSNEYTQSEAIDQFKQAIINATDVIANNFGGDTSIQNLVKNKGSIYEGNVIGYNEGIVDTSWYDRNYIEARYKTLTGNDLEINDIRDGTKIEDVIKYYEFSQFKKAIFKCVKVGYDDGQDGTGRVTLLEFEFTGEIK